MRLGVELLDVARRTEDSTVREPFPCGKVCEPSTGVVLIDSDLETDSGLETV